MPARPQWLLAIPDAIRQLEALDRELLVRRDIERLFNVSRSRAAQLMHTFGADLTGYARTLPRTRLLRQLRTYREGTEFRVEQVRRAHLMTELRKARLTGIRVTVPVRSARRASVGPAGGRGGRARPDRSALRGREGSRGEAGGAGAGAEQRLRAVRSARGGGGDIGMSEALVPAVTRPPVARTGTAAMALPAVIVAAGPVAVERFLEFFAASIANGRTRAAYGRAVGQFLSWCAARGLGLRAIAPLHVAAYIRTHPGSAPTVKQHLAAIRVLCDWLVIHQVLPVNPAAAVRGPKHVVTKGATPVLTPAETRSLLDGIDPGSLVRLRDRALLSVMVYSFARVSAVLGMRRQDYFLQGTRGWLRLHEKGGKRHDVPASPDVRGHRDVRASRHEVGHRPEEGAFDVVAVGAADALDGPAGRVVAASFDDEIERMAEDRGVPVHTGVKKSGKGGDRPAVDGTDVREESQAVVFMDTDEKPDQPAVGVRVGDGTVVVPQSNRMRVFQRPRRLTGILAHRVIRSERAGARIARRQRGDRCRDRDNGTREHGHVRVFPFPYFAWDVRMSTRPDNPVS